MKRLLFLLLTGLFAQLLVSCYPEGADDTEDYDVAMTTYDRDKTPAFFASLSTFAMPDSIVYFANKQDEMVGNHQFDQSILDLVEKEFTALGYRRIEGGPNNKPSFLVTVSAYSNVNYYFVNNNWYNYWDWYYGWNWWPITDGWYPYYPWSSVSIFSYRSGSIVIDMLDPNNIAAGSNKIPVVWSGIADGILSGTQTSILQRAEQEIRQCFLQSPYLGTNQAR